MKSIWYVALVWVATLGTGLMAGVFFAFSTFITNGLSRLPVPQGIAAMQAINIAVTPSLFLGLFLGTAAVCALVAVVTLFRLDNPGAVWVLIASLLYLFGALLVTIFWNIPLNNRLAAVDPGTVSSTIFWKEYLVRWVAWNHVRTISSFLSLICLLIALRQRS